MARGHPAKRGSVLDSLRSAGNDLVSIGEGVPVGFNQHRHDSRGPIPSGILAMESLPIPYTLTDFGRAQLALWRATELREAEAAGAHPSSETLRPRQ